MSNVYAARVFRATGDMSVWGSKTLALPGVAATGGPFFLQKSSGKLRDPSHLGDLF